MTRRTWLLVRDLLILAFTLWALIRAPQDVERLLAMYLPRVVDCTKPLQEGGHRLEVSRADGRAQVACKSARR